MFQLELETPPEHETADNVYKGKIKATRGVIVVLQTDYKSHDSTTFTAAGLEDSRELSISLEDLV